MQRAPRARASDLGQASIVKAVLGVAIVALLAIDLGRPLVSTVQLDTRAKAAATAAADAFKSSGDEDLAAIKAEAEAARVGAKVTRFEIRQDGAVIVALSREIPSWVWGKIFKSLYTLRAEAVEKPS